MTPKITVLMAVYNGAGYLKECIDSVLNQTYKDFEFIIIDDGSVDSTAYIIKSYNDKRIVLIQNKANLSQVSSLNVGLDYARAEYIARTDADDIMLPHRLERQLDFLEQRPEVALIGTWGQAINEDGEIIGRTRLPSRNEEIIATSLFGEFISLHSSVMYRKKVIFDIGKYNEAFSFSEDYKLIMDLFLSGYQVVNLPEILVQHRFHSERISVRDAKPQIARYLIAFRQFIENFTSTFSESNRDLLFDFLSNVSCMNKRYWQNGVAKSQTSLIAELLDILLANVSKRFKLSPIQQYFMKRIFYNRVLSFSYQGWCLKKYSSIPLYFYCVKKCCFILERPKLYMYPFAALFSALAKND